MENSTTETIKKGIHLESLKDLLDTWMIKGSTVGRAMVDGNLIEKRTVLVTKDVSDDFIERNIRNRPLSKINVNSLIREVTESNWQYNGEALKFDYNGHLMNGNHRMHMVSETGVPQIFDVTIGLPPESYATMDGGRKRNGSDTLAVAGIKNSACASSVTKTIFGFQHNLLSENRNSNRTIGNTNILKYYNSYTGVEGSITLGMTLSTKSGKLLSPSLIGGFHWLFSQSNAELANDFFEKLCTGLNIQDGDAVHPLRKTLIKSKENKAKTGKASVSHKTVIEMLVFAWNKTVEGKPCKVINSTQLEKAELIIK